jgi:hypothetical protein
MVYTDAIDEDDKAAAEDVEKELCDDCYDKIWDLGEVSTSSAHDTSLLWC